MASQSPPGVDDLVEELKERGISAIVALEAGARLLAEQDPQTAAQMMAQALTPSGGANLEELGLG